MANTYGISAYQQTNQSWKKETKKTGNTQSTSSTASTSSTTSTAPATQTKTAEVEMKKWTPLEENSCLIPKKQDGYGLSIGNVELSDKAKDYYAKLKEKFHGAEFILVSKDMKSQVQANALAYGSADKMVILIDDEKLERMANDENYRKKYEEIIENAQAKLLEAKTGIASSGASVKNFGMSVSEDGTTTFFASMEKATKENNERLAKQRAAKQEKIKHEKKTAEKQEKKEQLEEAKAERAEERERLKRPRDKYVDPDELWDTSKEYAQIEADSLDSLLNKISDFAYSNSSTILTEAEQSVGQNFDFAG